MPRSNSTFAGSSRPLENSISTLRAGAVAASAGKRQRDQTGQKQAIAIRSPS